MLTSQLSPALHVKHVLLLALDPTDQVTLTSPPDASAIAQRVNLKRRNGASV